MPNGKGLYSTFNQIQYHANILYSPTVQRHGWFHLNKIRAVCCATPWSVEEFFLAQGPANNKETEFGASKIDICSMAGGWRRSLCCKGTFSLMTNRDELCTEKGEEVIESRGLWSSWLMDMDGDLPECLLLPWCGPLVSRSEASGTNMAWWAEILSQWDDDAL